MNDLLAYIFKTDLYIQIASILFFAVALLFIKNKLILLFTGISKKTATDFDDIIVKSIQKPLTYLIIFASLVFIFKSLNGFYKLFDELNIGTIMYVLIVVIISWILIRILDNYFINKSFLKNLKKFLICTLNMK